MRHLITNIDTFIKNKELHIFLNREGEWYPFIEAPFSDLVKLVGQISVWEIDILEGCYLEPTSFNNQEDGLRNGMHVFEDSPTTWKINLGGSLDELRERNKSKILEFQSIYKVEISDKNSKEPYVKVRTTDDNVYFTKVPVFQSLVGLKPNEFNKLEGVFISPIMYKKGDTAEYNGRFINITQDNKIVASFNIRIEGTLDDHSKIYGNPILKKYTRDEHSDFFGDDSYRPSYEKYNGYNGWDDDTIDQAFDGDPEATWNVD